MKVTLPTTPAGFSYSAAPQRSPEWISIRAGRVGASDLGRWMSVSKRDGKPLKARLDLEKELAFEKTFNTTFNRYITDAMQQGIDNEAFMADQYSSAMGVPVEECGCFYSDLFVASPDRLVGDDGLLEIKWLQDSNWTAVLESQKPLDDHYLQIQGQLYASGRKWCDYVVGNGNTGRFIVVRVERDEDAIQSIVDSLPAVAEVKPLALENVFDFTSGKEITEEIEVWS